MALRTFAGRRGIGLGYRFIGDVLSRKSCASQLQRNAGNNASGFENASMKSNFNSACKQYRESPQHRTLVFIDLDRFKAV
ncbi:hypothetical protein KCP77_11030 [Salmonella enterica subsp. enterica]|nr:hypothetical protein KCP77_11030 [Salmonella enterica subsp. enterica]